MTGRAHWALAGVRQGTRERGRGLDMRCTPADLDEWKSPPTSCAGCATHGWPAGIGLVVCLSAMCSVFDSVAPPPPLFAHNQGTELAMKVVRQARLELSGGSTPDLLRPLCASSALHKHGDPSARCFPGLQAACARGGGACGLMGFIAFACSLCALVVLLSNHGAACCLHGW